MATLSFFNPETGEKVGEGKGSLISADKLDRMFAQTEEERNRLRKKIYNNRQSYNIYGAATTHISRKKWQPRRPASPPAPIRRESEERVEL